MYRFIGVIYRFNLLWHENVTVKQTKISQFVSRVRIFVAIKRLPYIMNPVKII
ncbi:hypothetical protein THZG08_90108 [Vibrio owensii]|nr:hypothetical protein THZG08_90108 [Vibrio owensii]CAH1594118.1 hypothetical protein THOA03_90108 [Vibrio owensii]